MFPDASVSSAVQEAKPAFVRRMGEAALKEARPLTASVPEEERLVAAVIIEPLTVEKLMSDPVIVELSVNTVPLRVKPWPAV